MTCTPMLTAILCGRSQDIGRGRPVSFYKLQLDKHITSEVHPQLMGILTSRDALHLPAIDWLPFVVAVEELSFWNRVVGNGRKTYAM